MDKVLISFLVGITQYTQRGHVARATLEATCFQTKAILDAMEKDSGHTLKELAVDGGMSNSDLCMQVRCLHYLRRHPLPLNLPCLLPFYANLESFGGTTDPSRPYLNSNSPPTNARDNRIRGSHRRRLCSRGMGEF
jgi:hypothetical protein